MRFSLSSWVKSPGVGEGYTELANGNREQQTAQLTDDGRGLEGPVSRQRERPEGSLHRQVKMSYPPGAHTGQAAGIHLLPNASKKMQEGIWALVPFISNPKVGSNSHILYREYANDNELLTGQRS